MHTHIHIHMQLSKQCTRVQTHMQPHCCQPVLSTSNMFQYRSNSDICQVHFFTFIPACVTRGRLSQEEKEEILTEYFVYFWKQKTFVEHDEEYHNGSCICYIHFIFVSIFIFISLFWRTVHTLKVTLCVLFQPLSFGHVLHYTKWCTSCVSHIWNRFTLLSTTYFNMRYSPSVLFILSGRMLQLNKEHIVDGEKANSFHLLPMTWVA